MKFDVGTFVVLAMVLIFCARYAWLRGSKARRRNALSGFEQMGNPKNPIDPQATRPLVRVYFAHTYLVVLGIVLLVGGVFFNITTGLDPALRAIWWAPMALGLSIFILIIH